MAYPKPKYDAWVKLNINQEVLNAAQDAARIENPVAYGLAVSLEVAEGIDIAIYDEIRTRIVSAVEIRAGEGS